MRDVHPPPHTHTHTHTFFMLSTMWRFHDTFVGRVKSKGMQDHNFGAKSANWLAGYRNCQPRFQFHQAKPGRILEFLVTSGQMHMKEKLPACRIDEYECQ